LRIIPVFSLNLSFLTSFVSLLSIHIYHSNDDQ
jgi:hypothetical protein